MADYEITTGFQPALAFTLDDVVDAMVASHDVLIRRSGSHRVSGVTWEIWGHELAAVLARTKSGISVRDTIQPDVAGPLSEGLDRLDSFHIDYSPLELEEMVKLRLIAEANLDSTLVIAYCQIRTRIRAGH